MLLHREPSTGQKDQIQIAALDFERKMTPWTMGLNILYGIGIAAIFGLSIVLELHPIPLQYDQGQRS